MHELKEMAGVILSEKYDAEWDDWGSHTTETSLWLMSYFDGKSFRDRWYKILVFQMKLNESVERSGVKTLARIFQSIISKWNLGKWESRLKEYVMEFLGSISRHEMTGHARNYKITEEKRIKKYI
jgi:hypothetical protein